MDTILKFEPNQMIESIEIAKLGEHNLDMHDLNRLKNKLFHAEQNTDIIRLARGEGRVQMLDEIISNDDVIFNWGMKGQHAFYQHSQFRDFLEPNSMDIAMMKDIVRIFKESITHQYSNHFHDFHDRTDKMEGIVEKIHTMIDEHSNSHESLVLIKDWICSVLHTAGAADFKNISPWVSTTSGYNRYKTAYLFGKGRIPFSRRIMGKNKRFVIFDTWVYVNEEHYAYERTRYLINTFRELGLPWYPDIHHEIMLKYAIYPHRLIGYYYFENDNLLYYKVNPHYWEYINLDKHFEIGNEIYIDQSNVCFPTNNPYRVIYSRRGNDFDVYALR